MPIADPTLVKRLKLDLENYRTIKQKDEKHAVEAIIAINPDWYWALAESILDSGYLPTENILVLKGVGARPALVVKEGNRRVSILKLLLGVIPLDGLAVPQSVAERIAGLTPEWKKINSHIPCVIYEPSEADVVNRIRSLTHGKGEKAGRDKWTAVAKARHNRDENGASEPALDLLEKYLVGGKNLSPQQAQRWAGNYRLTVLEEVMKRVAARVGAVSAPELSRIYPNIQNKTQFDNIIYDIGQEVLGFEGIRKGDVASDYGMPPPPAASGSTTNSANAAGGGAGAAPPGVNGQGAGASSTTSQAGGGAAGSAAAGSAAASSGGTSAIKVAAVPIHDEKHVKRILRKFSPKGPNREKVASLLKEIKNLTLTKNPMAFCFLLRSLFEISAKAYCTDHSAAGLSATKNGVDKKLVDVLREVTRHLTQNSSNLVMVRQLHGALTEIAKQDGILSVTSMNQLVHNPRFAHQPSDIAILFGNVFPLLDAMNS